MSPFHLLRREHALPAPPSSLGRRLALAGLVASTAFVLGMIADGVLPVPAMLAWVIGR